MPGKLSAVISLGSKILGVGGASVSVAGSSLAASAGAASSISAGVAGATKGAISSSSLLGSPSVLGGSSISNAGGNLRWQNGGSSEFLRAKGALSKSGYTSETTNPLADLWDQFKEVTDTVHDVLTPDKTPTEQEKKDSLEKFNDDLEELMKKMTEKLVGDLSKIGKSF